MKYHSEPLQSFGEPRLDSADAIPVSSGSGRSKRLLGALVATVAGFGLIYHGLSEKPVSSADAALDCSSPRDAWRWACHREENRAAQLPAGRAPAGAPGTTGSTKSESEPRTHAATVNAPSSLAPEAADRKVGPEVEPQVQPSVASVLPASPPEPPRRPAPESKPQTAGEAEARPATAPPRPSNRLADTYRAMIETTPTPPARPQVEEPAVAERPAPRRERPVEALIKERQETTAETTAREAPRRVVAAPTPAPAPIQRQARPPAREVDEPAPVVRRAERAIPSRSTIARAESNFPPEFRRVLRGYNGTREVDEPMPVLRRAERVNVPRPSGGQFPPGFLDVLRSHNMAYSSQPPRW